MIEIILDNIVSGYCAVDNFAKDFCIENGRYYADLVIEIEVSHDGYEWETEKIYLQYELDEDYFSSTHDWWEGQRFINIIGICYTEDINIPIINKTKRIYYTS